VAQWLREWAKDIRCRSVIRIHFVYQYLQLRMHKSTLQNVHVNGRWTRGGVLWAGQRGGRGMGQIKLLLKQ